MGKNCGLVTTSQLAEKLGVTPSRVRQWVLDGRITPAVYIPDTLLLFHANTKRPGQKKSSPGLSRRFRIRTRHARPARGSRSG